MGAAKQTGGRARGRLQQQSEQPTALAPVSYEEGRAGVPQLRTEILVEFTRALIRENPNKDMIYLALMAARSATGATDEEMRALSVAVLDEARKAPWPPGFF